MESVEVREEEEKTRCSKDKDKESLPHMDQGSRKRKSEGDPNEEEHEVKRRKEFESWDDLKELMKSRMLRGNCKRANEGPSDLFTDVCRRSGRTV